MWAKSYQIPENPIVGGTKTHNGFRAYPASTKREIDLTCRITDAFSTASPGGMVMGREGRVPDAKAKEYSWWWWLSSFNFHSCFTELGLIITDAHRYYPFGATLTSRHSGVGIPVCYVPMSVSVSSNVVGHEGVYNHVFKAEAWWTYSVQWLLQDLGFSILHLHSHLHT